MFAALKKPGVVLAALLAAGAMGSAQAAVGPSCADLGTLGAPGPASQTFGGTSAAGSFSDSFCFTLNSPHVVAASLTNVYVSFAGLTAGDISGFAAWLDGDPLALSTTSAPPATVQVLAGTKTLGSGTYYLNVSGTAGSNGASYGGNITVTPVPEAETYAMMLAGLGVVGFLAVRRRRDD
ncbi:MAG: FxDxF family PEP-CTERM protein [Burkholderiales bacterium]|nr:FxDxF family PEP-CTERM protein [Burkholderiales bacterium]